MTFLLASLIADFLYLSFSICILLVSFTLGHFNKSSPTLLQVATYRLALCWMCDSPRTGCAWRTLPIFRHTIRPVLAGTVPVLRALSLRQISQVQFIGEDRKTKCAKIRKLVHNVKSTTTSTFECKFVLRIGFIVKAYCPMSSVGLIHCN